MAGALHALGVHFGDRLMPPGDGENTKGYFEDLEIYRAHDRLLSAAGFSWDDPRPFDPANFADGRLAVQRREIGDYLQDRFSGNPIWAVKDPRLCLLVPLWCSILDELAIEPACVIVHRHPAEVAASLAQRDGFSAEKSVGLWLHHNLAAELSTRDLPRGFVSYDELLENPVETLSRLAESLEFDWPTAPESAADSLREFLAPTLRTHQAVPGENPDFGRFEPWALRLHQQLPSMEGGDFGALREGADAIRDEMEAMQRPLDSLSFEHTAQRTTALAEKLQELTGQVEALTDGTEDRLREVVSYLEAHDRERLSAQRAITLLEKQLDERARWLQIQDDEIKNHKEAIAALDEQLGDRTRWLQIQSESIDKLHAEVESLKEGRKKKNEEGEP